MSLTLRSALPSTTLTSSYATPEEDAQSALINEQAQMEGMGLVGRGLAAGLNNVGAMGNALAGQVVEPFSTTAAQPFFDAAQVDQQSAQRYVAPSDVMDFEQVVDPSTLGRYAARKAVENLPNMAVTLPLGIAGRVGLRGAAMAPWQKNVLATSMASMPLQMGEGAQTLHEDPYIMANTTPLERLGYSAGYGALTAPMEGADEALLMGRAMGAGKALKGVFKDGVKSAAKDALGHVAKAVPEAALTEGVPEALQEYSKQKLVKDINPNRDTSRDAHDIKESFFGGWAAGGGTSVAGRGMDVGWSQARDTREAVSNLLASRKPPLEGDDKTLVDWDKEDSTKRNTWGQQFADKIFGDEGAPAYMKEAAQRFKERMAAGGAAAIDAWHELRGGVETEQQLRGAVMGSMSFADALGKKGTKAEAPEIKRPEEKMIFDAFRNEIDPRVAQWGDTAEQSKIFHNVREALKSDDISAIPWDDLTPVFGSREKLQKAVTEMRANLVRDGQLEHDEGFTALLKGAVSQGAEGKAAKIEAIKRYARMSAGEVNDRDATQVFHLLNDSLSKYDSYTPEQKKKFKEGMSATFGKNAPKILDMFQPSGKTLEEHGVDVADDPADQVINETAAKPSRYIGQATQKARQNAEGSNDMSIDAHGGMWNLGHPDAETRSKIKTSYKAAKEALRAQGHDVRELTPMQYITETGANPGKVARSLKVYRPGQTREQTLAVLKDHPGRMLAGDAQDAIGEQKGEVASDQHIADLAKATTHAPQAPYHMLDKETAAKVRGAMGNRKKMADLGFPHGNKLVLTKAGMKLENNLNTSDNGRFTVTMKDGTKHVVSAQELIRHQREQRGSKISPLQAFHDGLAAIATNPNFERFDVHDIKGNRITPSDTARQMKKKKEGEKEGEHRTEAMKQFGKHLGSFGPYFRLSPNLTLGAALRASNKGASKDMIAERVSELEDKVAVLTERKEQLERSSKIEDQATFSEVETALEKAEKELEEARDEQATQNAVTNEMEDVSYTGEETDAYSTYDRDMDAFAEHAGKVSHRIVDQERVSDINFNADGTEKQSVAKPVERGFKPVPVNLKEVKGRVSHFRPGVKAEHITESMREIMGTVDAVRKLLGDNALVLTSVADQYLANAAAAQADGNIKASHALQLLARERIYAALEAEAIRVTGDPTQAEYRSSVMAAAADLIKFHEQFAAKSDQIMADAVGYSSHLGDFKGLKGGKKKTFVPARDRITHRSEFLNAYRSMTDEELTADGVARAKRIKSMQGRELTDNQKKLLEMMEVENDIARSELMERKAGKAPEVKLDSDKVEQKSGGYPATMRDGDKDRLDTTVRRERESREAQMKANAEQTMDAEEEQTRLDSTRARAQRNAEALRQQHKAQEAELDKLMSELAAGSDEAMKMAQALGKAFREVGRAILNGQFDKAEVVAALRQAWQHFKNAAKHADEARKEIESRLRTMVQQKVAEFQRAAKAKADGTTQGFVNRKDEAMKATASAVAEKFRKDIAEHLENAKAKAALRNDGWQIDSNLRPKPAIMAELDKGGFTRIGYSAFLHRSVSPDLALAMQAVVDWANANYPNIKINSAMVLSNASQYDATVIPTIGNLAVAKRHLDAVLSGNLDQEMSIALLNTLHHELGHLADHVGKIPIKGFEHIGGSAYASNYNKRLLGDFVNGIGFIPRGELAKEAARLGRSFFTENSYTYPMMAMDDVVNSSHYAAEIVAQSVAYYRSQPEYLKKLSPMLYDYAKNIVEAIDSGDQVKVYEAISEKQGQHEPNEYENRNLDDLKLKDDAQMFKHRYAYGFDNRRGATAYDWADMVLGLDELFGRLGNISTELKHALSSVPDAIKAGDVKALRAVAKQLVKSGIDTLVALARVIERIVHASMYNPTVASVSNLAQYAGAAYWLLGSKNLNRPTKPTPRSRAIFRKLSAIAEKTAEIVVTAQNTLIDSNNTSFEKIGRMFSNETGAQDKDIGFMTARVQKTNQMVDRLVKVIGKADKADIEAAMEALRAEDGKLSSKPEVAAIQKGIRKLLDDSYDYLKAAGVKINKQENYFPRAWDSIKIAENREAFTKAMAEAYEAKYGRPAASSVVEKIVAKLIENRGADPLTEGDIRTGYTPFMSAKNERVLDFANSPELRKFMKDDLVLILSTYAYQASHTAEYTRRFGENGAGLREMLNDGIGEAIKGNWEDARKKANENFEKAKKTATTDAKGDWDKYQELLTLAGYPDGRVEIKDIASLLDADTAKSFTAFEGKLRRTQRAIMAMEGTLGFDINKTMRKLNSGLIVYENMRLLTMSLFSQVIDPFGVVIRGGTMDHAFDTFVRGVKGSIAAWRGKPLADDKLTRIAMQLGIIDAGNAINSQGQLYSGVNMGDTARSLNEKLFRWNGVEGFSQGTRIGATGAAIDFIKENADPATRNEHSDRWLAELGLTKEDVVLRDGELDYTNKAIQNAIFRWVDGAILRPNAALRPSWASDPHYALLFHLKQFTYSFQKVLLERIKVEMDHGNYDPAFAMALSIPAIVAADFLRGLAANGGEVPEWKKKWKFEDYIMHGVERSGALGVAQFGVDASKYGPLELAGPVAEHVNKTTKVFNRAYKHDVALDHRAEATGRASDKQKADDYDWKTQGAKKGLREALPAGPVMKHYVYDPLVE